MASRVTVATSTSSAPGTKEAGMQIVKRFLSDDSGATAIEYALLAAGIAFVIIAAVNALGTTTRNKITAINTSLK